MEPKLRSVNIDQLQNEHRNWLQKQILRSQTEMFSVQVDITPALAQLFLERNTDNRPVREHRVQRWAEIMAAGKWLLTSQGVSFNPSGELQNGQHRLMAIVRSGATVRMFVTFGEPRAARFILDNGTPRSGSDVLDAADFRNSTQLAATARLLWRIEIGKARWTNLLVENSDLVQFCINHPGLSESVKAAQNIGSKVPCSRSGLGAAHFLIVRKHGEEATAEFFQKLKDGAPGEVVGLCRDRLMTSRPPMVEVAALTVKAWNKQLGGERVEQLTWRKTEPFPAVE